jgi:hypothetical protein
MVKIKLQENSKYLKYVKVLMYTQFEILKLEKILAGKYKNDFFFFKLILNYVFYSIKCIYFKSNKESVIMKYCILVYSAFSKNTNLNYETYFQEVDDSVGKLRS